MAQPVELPEKYFTLLGIIHHNTSLTDMFVEYGIYLLSKRPFPGWPLGQKIAYLRRLLDDPENKDYPRRIELIDLLDEMESSLSERNIITHSWMMRADEESITFFDRYTGPKERRILFDELDELVTRICSTDMKLIRVLDAQSDAMEAFEANVADMLLNRLQEKAQG